MPSIVGELTKGAAFNKLVDRTNVITDTVPKTGAYTATTGDDVILCDSSGGIFTITLYTAVGNDGRTITIKKIDSSANAVTVDGDGTETIDGALTKTLNYQYSAMKLISNGTSWFII